ncbi:MAG: DUF6768 family protein [Planctomycetota bacterium]|jgi:hypothetical protein
MVFAGITWHVIAAKVPVAPSWLRIAVFCLLRDILVPMLTPALEQTRDRIMYAAIFVCCNLWIGFVSVFGWVMMRRPRINREIKRLEFRIAESAETIGSK